MTGKQAKDAGYRQDNGAEKISALSPAPGARRQREPRIELPDIAKSEMEPQIRSAVMQMMDELDRLKDELSSANKRVSQLEGMADEDPLVPVLNRRGFDRELERTLAYAKRYGTTVSLIYLDLDDFKSVNDRYGHAGGDAALKHFGAILMSNVRGSDLVGRLGGDEFAIILHHADVEAAVIKAAQFADQISRSPVRFGDVEFYISMTTGTAALRDGDTAASVLERADAAMYESKKARRKLSAF